MEATLVNLLLLLGFALSASAAVSGGDEVILSPGHIPAGEEVEVTVSGAHAAPLGAAGGSNESFEMRVAGWPGTGLPAQASKPCRQLVADRRLAHGEQHHAAGSSGLRLACPVEWPSAGTALAELVASPGGRTWTAVLRVYSKAIVEAVTPQTLSSAGQDIVQVKLQVASSNFGTVVLRFVEPSTGLSVDCTCAAEIKESGLMLETRTPSFSQFRETSVLQVWVSLNGRSFFDSGFLVSLRPTQKMKIGFLYVTSADDLGWTFQHNVARLALEDRFFGQIETVYQNNVREWGLNECGFCSDMPGWNASENMWDNEPHLYRGTHESAVVMKKWIEEGVKVIFATSFYYQWDAFHMAARYPDVSFVHAGGWLTQPNMAQVFPRVYQARYLTGIVMAWYIKSKGLPKKVGYVSAFQIGETVRAINAFKLGLEKVDPEIELYVIWLMTWSDDRRQRLGTSRLLAFYGVEGMAQHTDSREPQLVAQEHGKVGVGYNTDMLLTVGDSVLTSPVLVWGEDYANLVQKALDGESFDNAALWHGPEMGAWRLSDFSPKVPPEAKMMVHEEYQKLAQGQDDIFCKPNLRDNRGRWRNGPENPAVNPVPWEADHLVPETTCLTGNVVNQMCQEYSGGQCVDHWLLEGVYDACTGLSPKVEGIASPNLTAGECFLGMLDIPDVCPLGEHLTLRGCVPVDPGFYSRDEKALPCRPGYAAPMPGAARCDPCQSGTAAPSWRAVSCDLCEPGSYSDTAPSSSCRTCEPGRFSASWGATACDICAFGSYAPGSGSLGCTPCEPDMVTLSMAETNETACVCKEGMYRPIGESGCAPCPSGMRCPPASDMNHLSDGVEGPYPLVKSGYMTLASEPLRAYRCLLPRICPGGPPATCDRLRDTTAVACGRCRDGAYEAEQDCRACTSADLAPVLIAVVAGLCCVGLLTWQVNRDVFSYTNAGITCITLLAIACSGIQALAVFQQLSMIWFEPMRSVIRALSLLSFDMKILRITCLVGTRPVLSYLTRQLVAPAAVVALSAILAVKKLKRKNTHVCNELCNTVGTMFNVFFISIILSCLSPFVCNLQHPGGAVSMTESPSLVCYTGGEHLTMVAMSVVACGFVPVPFLALVVVFTLRYPAIVADSSPGSHDRLHAMRFVFFRYAPRRYYYGALLLLRSLLMALAPVLVKDPGLQVCIVFLVLVSFLMLQQQLRPWRCPTTNAVDGVLTSLLLILLLSGAMASGSGLDAGAASVQIVGTASFVAFVLSAAIPLVRAVWARLVPEPWYEYFICHHKAAAAAQARFLKVLLQAKTNKRIFIDVDNLIALGSLFNIVKCQVSQVIVYLTRDTLSRPWCVGEIVSAYAVERVTVTTIKTTSYIAPPEEQLRDLVTFVDLSNCNLVEYGIHLSMVRKAFTRLLSDETRCIPMGGMSELRGSTRLAKVVDTLLNTSTGRSVDRASVSFQPVCPGNVVISTDDLDDEALAAEGILLAKIRQTVFGIVPSGICCLAEFAADDLRKAAKAVAEARCVIVILSSGTLSSLPQLVAITELMVAQSRADPLSGLARGSTMTAFDSVTRQRLSMRNPVVIPLNTPDFNFPGTEYFERTLPRIWPADVKEANALLQEFFRHITIRFQTNESDDILETQVKEVASRIPRTFSAASSAASLQPECLYLKTASRHSTSPGEADDCEMTASTNGGRMGPSESRQSRLSPLTSGSVPSDQLGSPGAASTQKEDTFSPKEKALPECVEHAGIVPAAGSVGSPGAASTQKEDTFSPKEKALQECVEHAGIVPAAGGVGSGLCSTNGRVKDSL